MAASSGLRVNFGGAFLIGATPGYSIRGTVGVTASISVRLADASTFVGTDSRTFA
jgi:hypothetical protein